MDVPRGERAHPARSATSRQVGETYDARLGRELDVVVGRTAVPLEARRGRVRTQETNLGDFIADAMRARLKTDVALINGGGIRSDRIVPPGPLTRRDVAGHAAVRQRRHDRSS